MDTPNEICHNCQPHASCDYCGVHASYLFTRKNIKNYALNASGWGISTAHVCSKCENQVGETMGGTNTCKDCIDAELNTLFCADHATPACNLCYTKSEYFFDSMHCPGCKQYGDREGLPWKKHKLGVCTTCAKDTYVNIEKQCIKCATRIPDLGVCEHLFCGIYTRNSKYCIKHTHTHGYEEIAKCIGCNKNFTVSETPKEGYMCVTCISKKKQGICTKCGRQAYNTSSTGRCWSCAEKTHWCSECGNVKVTKEDALCGACSRKVHVCLICGKNKVKDDEAICKTCV